jgi:hypothetical protein
MPRDLGLDALMADATRTLIPSDHAILAHYSVPRGLIALGMVGAAMAHLPPSGPCWSPDGHSRVFVTPARIHPLHIETECPEAEMVALHGCTVDLIAWRPESPDEWRPLTDYAECLGAYPPQLMSPEPVPVSETPLDWLRNHARGICPLSHDPAERQRLLLGISTLAASDMDHAMALRRLVERPTRIPQIVIAGEKR